MRARIATTAFATALAAGCSGSHGPAPGPSWAAGSHDFIAHVRVTVLPRVHHLTAGPPQTLLVDTATGRFRITSRGSRLLSVSDGHRATRAFGPPGHPRVITYHGSQRFLADHVDRTPLRVVRAFLAGSGPPTGVRVQVVAQGPPARLIATTATERLRITIGRAGHVAAGAFRAPRGKVVQVVRQLAPGVRPGGALAAYWLGPRWNGRPARTSSAASGRAGYYVVGYPHLAVEVTRGVGVTGNRAVTLRDGTRATLRVARVADDGTVVISSASSIGGSSIGMQGFIFGTTDAPGTTMAFVFVPHAMITLSGSDVTPRSAAAIARSLRPL